MKKISILMLLVVCVAIGGVYAAWIYSEGNFDSVDTTISHGMASATTNTPAGVLEITDSSALVTIDQTSVDNYTAKLNVSGSVTVRFTPGSGASPEVIEAAVPVTARVYVTDADLHQYNEKDIYVSTGTTVDVVWNKQTDGTFLATVDAAKIATLFELGDTFVLDNHDKYEEFHGLEEHITLTIIFEQKAPVVTE